MNTKIFNLIKENLTEAFDLPIHQQKAHLQSRFETWLGNAEQTDDVCVMGSSMPDSPSADSLCAFAIPLPHLPKFKLPSLLDLLPALPIPRLAISLNCSLSNPLNVTSGLKSGGGRETTRDPDPDDAGGV